MSMSISSRCNLTLRQRVLQSGSWTLFGYGATQMLRLGGNLVLTRLLFPEAFGMMAIITGLIYGVHMLTDVGIGPSIVQRERGNDPAFLNTAWTVQILRGFMAWGVLYALALPIANFYDEPMLSSMLPAVGLCAIIGGFNSTKLLTAQRNLDASRVMLIEVFSYAFGLLSTIFLAWLLQSVWALVWGSVIGAILLMCASHAALHGIKNQIAWDREALDHLRGFGRWIMLGSALTFLSVEGARLLIGAVLDMRQLALFSLSSTMSLLLWQAVQRMTGRVFFPAYAEVHRSAPKNLTTVLYKARLTVILPSWSLAVFFVFFGSQLMSFLYDERYHESGIMLQQLAAGSLIACVWGSYAGALLAQGKVATTTLLTAIQILCQFGFMFIGHHFWGAAGLVMGVAAANWAAYPFYAFALARNGLWQPRIDLVFLAVSIIIVMLAWPHLAHGA